MAIAKFPETAYVEKMKPELSDSRLTNVGAETILEAFDEFHRRFKAITRRAKTRFEERDWRGMQYDTAERLDLYKGLVDVTEAELRELLGKRIEDRSLWTGMKAVYSGKNADRDDWELAETFFNSATRRIFATEGVNPRIEFVASDFGIPPRPARTSVYRTYRREEEMGLLLRRILLDQQFNRPFRNLDEDVALLANAIAEHLAAMDPAQTMARIEMVKQPFFRGMGAYLVGRIITGTGMVPLVFSLLNDPEGVFVDGVLLNEDDVSILFSFTRSYFHIDVQRPYDLVAFLKGLIPRKPIAELYTSIGYNKHGKTELYRDLQHHIAACCLDRFEISRGKQGMVMVVFNMPQDAQVFKIIRDRFPAPKKTTRKEVMAKYDFVFKHDRAGRMVEAQTFEHLKFGICCFTDKLLQELRESASGTVEIKDDSIIVHHAYVERRVTPLDIYLDEADEEDRKAVVLDYGRAIKDLAYSNIFPGDMLIKNFGVTQKGRVVFYDYDEISPLLACNFRKLPQAHTIEDELAAEPWFHVDENDVFPEEFPRFLGFPDDLTALLLQHHGDLFQVDFWRRTQENLRAGHFIHIFPYSKNQKLKRSSGRPTSIQILAAG